MNVLIISNYFSPQESVGALRPNAICKYFSEEGDRVFVITSPKDGVALSSEVGAGDVIIYSIDYFGGAKKIQVVDKRAITPIKPQKSKLISVVTNVHRWLKKNIFCNFLDPRSFWVRPAVSFARKLFKDFDIDLIISSSPAYPVHLVASQLKKEFPKVFWSADYRDLWSGNPFFTGVKFVRDLEVKGEIACLRQADMITTVSHALAEYLSKKHLQQVVVYTNGFEMMDAIRDGGFLYRAGGMPRTLVYTGSYIDHLYDIRPLVMALESIASKIKPDQFQVVFIGDGSAAKEKLDQYPVALSYMKFLEQVSRAEALKAQAEADLLLFFGAQENGGQAIKGVISGKVFEYIVSNTEIMAIGTSQDMEVGGIIMRLQAGFCYENNSDLIAKRILDLVRNGKKTCEVDPVLLLPFRRDVITKKMRMDLINRMRARVA